MTPMLRQYYDLKSQCEDAVLFFRMGDFYEIFGSDAEMVAPKLEVVLTAREKGDNEKIPFCGVPHHSARGYMLKLLKMGYKVAIADQIEDPKLAKGLVKRDITRVLTPGCVDELEGLDPTQANYIAALNEVPVKGRGGETGSQWVLALLDVSTGELRLGNPSTSAELIGLIERSRPRELLLRRFAMDKFTTGLGAAYIAEYRPVVSALPESPLRDEMEQTKITADVLGTRDLWREPSGLVAGGQAVLASLFAYVNGLKMTLRAVRTVRPLNEPGTMTLLPAAVRDLEIFESSRRREFVGSLMHTINRTATPMGARFLRQSLAQPLRERQAILDRRAAIKVLVESPSRLRDDAHEFLRGIPDLERIAGRVSGRSVRPQELALLRDGLSRAAQLGHLIADVQSPATQSFKDLAASLESHGQSGGASELLASALADAPSDLGAGCEVFRAGFDTDLDRLVTLTQSGSQLVAEYENELRARTGIASLKIKSHQTFGLLIEITKSNLAKTPADFIRRQTMVNCERFVTPRLVELNDQLSSATEQAVAQEALVYTSLLERLATFDFSKLARALAYLDFLFAMTRIAVECRWVEPDLSHDRSLELRGTRHPVVERYVPTGQFVPNDVILPADRNVLLLTGPNMGGKSTLMRQTALAAILNQMGSYVPATSARMPIFDRIFTRIGASDDLARGQSTFMVEMTEVAELLRQASADSLVILDEVGRGTSTTDGLALARAILEEIAQSLGCHTLFATHYHELVDLSLTIARLTIGQMEVVEDKDRITFTHRLIGGSSHSSYGLEVARLAGVPTRVVNRARALVDAPKGADAPLHQARAQAAKTSEIETPQRSEDLVPTSHQAVIARLIKVNVHRTTPLQALNILNDLKTLVDNPGMEMRLWHGDKNPFPKDEIL